MENLKQLEDEQLVLLFQNEKEDNVFEEIYLRYKDRIYNYIRNILYHKDEGSIRELIDDIFIIVYQEIEKLRSTKAFKVWIYRIARSVGIKVIRKEKSARIIFNQSIVENYYPANDQSYPTPEQWVIKNEMKRFVFEEIAKLSMEEREIIMLKFYNNLTFKEVSKIMGLSLRAVKYKIKNALMSINLKLKREGYLS